MWKLYLDVGGGISSLIGLVVAVIIAVRQDRQLKGLNEVATGQHQQLTQLKDVSAGQHQQLSQLKEIATGQDLQLKSLNQIELDTSKTVKKLYADSYKNEMVSKFFCLEHGVERFKCIFPIEWRNKPLPSIHTGDYHALHVLQTLLGNERLEPELSDFRKEPHGDRDEENNDGMEGDAIFLCTPQANSALARLAKNVEIGSGHAPQAPMLDNVELPCWFANEISPSTNTGNAEVTKKIWIPVQKVALESPSELEYKNCKGDCRHEPGSEIQMDYAILLRLSLRHARKVFVIAGIHQYGTWIAGEFLSRLALEYDERSNNSIRPFEREILLQQGDFAAIVYGEFCTKTLAVGHLGISNSLLWRRNDDRWIRIGE